jgi:ZIP family zinc transporter
LAVDLLYAAFLGIISGLIPVYVGVAPVRAIRNSSASTKIILISVAVGILLFLFADVFNQAGKLAELVEGGLGAVLLLAGLITGLLGLTLYESIRARGRRHAKGYHVEVIEEEAEKRTAQSRISLAYLIALGIGLHNLGEGLAIGSAYAAGEISLSYLLIIGFALHNGTEGFGIVAPLPKGSLRIRDPFLMAFMAGAPAVLGSIIGAAFYSVETAVLFFALAAGAILYVVVELTPIVYTKEHRHLVLVGITIGIVAMYLTDLLLGV